MISHPAVELCADTLVILVLSSLLTPTDCLGVAGTEPVLEEVHVFFVTQLLVYPHQERSVGVNRPPPRRPRTGRAVTRSPLGNGLAEEASDLRRRRPLMISDSDRRTTHTGWLDPDRATSTTSRSCRWSSGALAQAFRLRAPVVQVARGPRSARRFGHSPSWEGR